MKRLARIARVSDAFVASASPFLNTVAVARRYIETPQVGPDPPTVVGAQPPSGAVPKASLHMMPQIPHDPLVDGAGRVELPAAVPHELSPEAVPENQRLSSGQYRRVGNVIVVTVNEFPFKFGWELNSILRFLRLEFHKQTVIVPDEPKYRAAIFRVRHIVAIEMIDIEELKALLGVPDHITFTDLAKTLPEDMSGDRPAGTQYDGFKNELVNFTVLRKERLRDVLARDAVELRLLKEKKRLKQSLTDEK